MYINEKISQKAWLIYILTVLLVFFLAKSSAHALGLGVEPYRSSGPAITVALPYKLQNSDQNNPYGPGMNYELLEMFLQRHNYKVRRVYSESYDEALRLLQRGGVDILIGFGSETPFEADKVGRSPALTEFYPIMVVLPEDGEKLHDLDLSNVHFNRVSYSTKQLSSVEDLGGNAILLEPSDYAVLMPMNTTLKTVGRLAEKTGYYWFWNESNSTLNKQMHAFWADPEVKQSLVNLSERYYGFLPKDPMHSQLHEINRAITKKMGIYKEEIAKASAEYRIDPLLLSAVIFQESRFNPTARSHTGVRGIMQLTMSTADMLGVNRLDPEEAIMGGARYLRDIYDSIDFVDGMDDWDKWFVTLAGFNQGPTIMRRALKAAESEGRDLGWASMRQFYPSLHAKGLASSGFRPKEAVNYVENIRYYYFVLSGLANIGWFEQEHLAGFFALAD